jgi:hypothetical protein
MKSVVSLTYEANDSMLEFSILSTYDNMLSGYEPNPDTIGLTG